mgnify:CR=1 FL=1
MTTQSAEHTPTRTPSKPLTRRGERTRAKLLAAAKEIFEEQGFFDARITDIATRAGVAHGTFYTYFSSKEEIFRELALVIGDELAAPLSDVILATESKATPEERIREAMRRYLERYRDEAKIMGVIEQVSRTDAVLEAARTQRQDWDQSLVADSIVRMQAHGLSDAGLDPEITVLILGAMTERFSEMWLTQGRLDCNFEEGVDQLTRVYVNALGLRSTSN